LGLLKEVSFLVLLSSKSVPEPADNIPCLTPRF